MALGPTVLTDVVVPEIFTPYVQQLTTDKSEIIQSGIAVSDLLLSSLLSGGGFTFNSPSFQDLDASDDTGKENISLGVAGSASSPDKIETLTEVQIRLSRNKSWGSMNLAGELAGADPMLAIANRVSNYWTLRLQKAFVATMNGVIANNVDQDNSDYENDISNGGAFLDGVTNFSTEAFIDTKLTMGDSAQDLTGIIVHSVVKARMEKNNLIDFIPDSRGETDIPTFLGLRVIEDDGMPVSGAGTNVYDTWLFGTGAVRLGFGAPSVPTELDRKPADGAGGGQDILHNRVSWIIHPVGHAWVGTKVESGGPDNTIGTDPLNAADSWSRVFPERKQIKFARLVTTEHGPV